MQNILEDDYYYNKKDIDINDAIEEKSIDIVMAIEDVNATCKILKEEENIHKQHNSNYNIGFISNFYVFRNRIRYIDNVDIKQVNEHKDFINIDAHITISELLHNSINYFNRIMNDYISPKLQRFIELNDREIAFLALQYNACDYIDRFDDKKEYNFEIFYIQNHPVTKFFTLLILYYFYNELFAQKIKSYKKDHSDITDVNIMAILYKKLIEFSKAFNNCNTLFI